MTFPLLWLPRRRSLTSRVNRLARADAWPDRAAELLPQPQFQPLLPPPPPPLSPSQPIAPETVAIPDIPEPFTAVQEALDQIPQTLAPPEVPWPGFQSPVLDGAALESVTPDP